MTKSTNNDSTCKSVCWIGGLVVGAAATYTLIYLIGQPRLLSAVLGVVTMLIVGLLLRWMLCNGTGALTEDGFDDDLITPLRKQPNTDAIEKAAATTATLAGAAKAGTKASGGAGHADTGAGAAMLVGPDDDTLVAKLDEKVMAAASKLGETAAAAALRAQDVDDDDDDDLSMDTSPVLGDSEELTAEELYDWDEAEEAEFKTLNAATEADALTKPKVEIAAEPKPETAVQPEVKAEVVPQPAAEPEPAPAVAEAPEIKPLEPKGLDAPEGGVADDLTRIEGIAVDEQAALNKAGIYHYAQFVGMNRRELAWLNQNLTGEPTAGIAEDWRKQAIQLAREAG